MTRIDVRRGLLVVGFLCCAACKTSQAPAAKPSPALAARTFTFTVEFNDKHCPARAKPDVANCNEAPSKPADPDCVYVSKSRKDKVKFKPTNPSAEPKFTVSFPAECNLRTVADPSQPDGKHWDLVDDDAPPYKVCKFRVMTDNCTLDPTIIVGE